MSAEQLDFLDSYEELVIPDAGSNDTLASEGEEEVGEVESEVLSEFDFELSLDSARGSERGEEDEPSTAECSSPAGGGAKLRPPLAPLPPLSQQPTNWDNLHFSDDEAQDEMTFSDGGTLQGIVSELMPDVDSQDERAGASPLRLESFGDVLEDEGEGEEGDEMKMMSFLDFSEEQQDDSPAASSSAAALESPSRVGESPTSRRTTSPEPLSAPASQSLPAQESFSHTLKPTRSTLLQRRRSSQKRRSLVNDDSDEERAPASPHSSQRERSQSSSSSQKRRAVTPSNSQSQRSSAGSRSTPSSSQRSVPPAGRPTLTLPKPFKFTRINKIDPETGLPLTKADIRSAIIEQLEALAVGVLEQMCDDVALLAALLQPEPPDEGPQDSQSQPSQRKRRRKTKRPTPSKVEIHTVNRLALESSRKLSWPARRGKHPAAAANARSLAAFLRLVELIAEGLRASAVSTKRELFYRDPNLFGSQPWVDSTIEDLAASVGVRRHELHVVAASKGLFAGCLKITTDDQVIHEGQTQGALTPSTERIDSIACEGVRWVLVVEKDAVFQSLATPDFYRDGPVGGGIVLTGKGYPDLASRELLHRLDCALGPSVPLLALVDSDPHGINILSTYKLGSRGLEYDKENLTVPRLEWVGVKGSEWTELGVPRESLVLLQQADRKRALSLLRRGDLPREWGRELQVMMHSHRKAEIEVLSAVRPTVLAREEDATQSQSQAQGQSSQTLRLTASLAEQSQEEQHSPLLRYLFKKIGDRVGAEP